MNNEINFKSEYKELQKSIAPDEEFLRRLAREMEHQKQQREIKQSRKKRALVLVPALATVCAGAAALTIFLNLPKRTKPTPFEVNAAADVKFAYTTGVFENETSLAGGDALPTELAEMVSQGGSALYKSGTNTFDYDDRLGDSERAALAKKIRSAQKTDKKAADGGDFYMLTLENGDVFKFRISDDILIAENNFYFIP